MNKKPVAVLLSCEHAVNTVPALYQPYFASHSDLLKTHRGIDFGALTIATHLSKALSCNLIQATATRLLIDCNRSLSHPHCFSEITALLPIKAREQIIQHYYLPFRQQIEGLIKQYIAAGYQVWHLSIHSFTPVWHNEIRSADVGFLYDPRRKNEKIIAKHWQQQLNQLAPELRVRMNYPYLGKSDGFTSYLRKHYNEDDYAGIEVENNQALISDEQALNHLLNVLTYSLQCIK